MVYITGDTHGGYTRFGQIKRFIRKNHLSNEDVVVVLGDMSVNFSLNERDQNSSVFTAITNRDLLQYQVTT